MLHPTSCKATHTNTQAHAHTHFCILTALCSLNFFNLPEAEVNLMSSWLLQWLVQFIFSDIWMNIPSFYLQIHGYEHHFAQNDGKQDVTVVSNYVDSSPTKRVKKAVEWTSEIWMLLVTGRRFRHQQSLTWYRVWGQWHLFRCTRALPVLWSWILHLSSRNPSLNNFICFCKRRIPSWNVGNHSKQLSWLLNNIFADTHVKTQLEL